MKFTCDRCDKTESDEPIALIDAQYMVDDLERADGALCPDCASDDDPHHVPGSWLLSWN